MADGHNSDGVSQHGNGHDNASQNCQNDQNDEKDQEFQKDQNDAKDPIGRIGRNGTAAVQKCACQFPKIYTDDFDTEIGTIKKFIQTEILQMKDGSRYSRRHVCEPQTPNEWREVVRQTQVDKNPHWSLFAAFDNDNDGTKGRIWQVNGDPEVGMHYAHRSAVPGVAVFISASFLDCLLVCKNFTEAMEARVDEIANTIKPPGPGQSPDQPRKIDFRRGTCRTWVWEVLERLVEEGITTSEVAAKARQLQPMPPLK